MKNAIHGRMTSIEIREQQEEEEKTAKHKGDMDALSQGVLS